MDTQTRPPAAQAGRITGSYLTTQDGVVITDEQRWQLVEYMKTL